MDSKFETEQLLYSVNEIANFLQTGRARIYVLIKKGLLSTTTIGRDKITKKALDDFLSLVEGVNVNELVKQIPDGWTLEDLAQNGVLGERAKKSGPTNADLKKFLSRGTIQKQLPDTTISSGVSPCPLFLSNLNHRKGPPPVYSAAERKRMAMKGMI